MKKPSILLNLTILPALLSACSSYISNPGKISEVEGTYKLTVFDITKDNEDKIDFVKDKNAVSYLVINGSGYGYTSYQDADTSLFVENTKINFDYESDEDGNPTELIKSLTYTTGLNDPKYRSPKEGVCFLGVNIKNKTLSVHLDNTKVNIGSMQVGSDRTMNVTYQKVNKTTDFSYLEKQLGQSYNFLPYELKGIHQQWMSINIPLDEINPYIYYYAKLDVFNKTAQIKYALKEDQTKVNDQITFDYAVNENDVSLTIENNVYHTSVSGNLLPTYFYTDIKYYDNVNKIFVEEAGENIVEVNYSLSKEFSITDENIEETINSFFAES